MQQRVFHHRPRCDDANHVALDEPLDLLRVFELLDERDLVALVNQFRDVRLDVMMRYARHRQAYAFRERTRRQYKFEFARGDFRVGIKRLVEIAEAKQHERVGKARLDLPILREHRRHFLFVSHRCAYYNCVCAEPQLLVYSSHGGDQWMN